MPGRQRFNSLNHRNRLKDRRLVIIKREGSDVGDAGTTLEIDGGDAFNSGTASLSIDGGDS